VIQSGDSFIRVAMRLDMESQLNIRHMITGLLEPGHSVSDADLTKLLTTPRGLSALHLHVLYTLRQQGIDFVPGSMTSL